MNSRPTQTTPLYSEEQTRRWLAFLARNMQQHGQTVFLIEQIQPTWLLTQTMRRYYTWLDRLVGGLSISLSIGPTAVLLVNLALWSRIDNSGNVHFLIFLGCLSIALICGLAGGLFGGRAIATAHSQRTISQIVGSAIVGWFFFSIISSVYHVLLFDLNRGLADGLITGLAGALVGALTGSPSIQPRFITVVETLHWSLVKASRFALRGLVIGLIGGMGYGLIYELVGRSARDFPTWLSFGLTSGLAVSVIAGLVGGLTGAPLNTSIFPNQGIWRSAQSAIYAGAVYGLAIGGAVALIYGLIGGPQTLLHGFMIPQLGGGFIKDAPAGFLAFLSGGYVSGLYAGLIYGGLYGLTGGLIAALAYGGQACLAHVALRLILWRQGVMPWHYARFLNYAATELRFLQKVGGGYIFIHRYLLEHFAAMAAEGEEHVNPIAE